MLNQLEKNIILLSALAVSALSCQRLDDEIATSIERDKLSIQSVNVLSTSDWQSRSESEATSKIKYIEMSDSSLIYAIEENFDGKEVDSTSAPVTRGTPITNVKDLTDIRMNLFNSGSNTWSLATPKTEAITISQSGSRYACSPTYVWSSKTDKISMFTYTPSPNADNGLTEAAKGVTIGYTVPTDVAKQPDFCASAAELNVVNTDGKKSTRSLTLRHQLTAIGFSVNGWGVTLNKIEVSGVAFTGTYSIETGNWSVGAVGSEARLVGIVTATPSFSYEQNKTWMNITNSNGYLMMIPQTLGDNAKVAITYTDANKKVVTSTTQLRTMTAGKWTAGSKITYNIQLEVAPAIGVDPITLTMPWKKGYTTSSSIPFVVRDPDDRYIFSWDETWNRIHRGEAKVANTSGGASTGWSTDALNTTAIWFYADNDNLSTTSNRSSTITLTGWRTAERTFTVIQSMKPFITVDGMPSTDITQPDDMSTYTVTVKSNYDWEAILNGITMDKTTGVANITGQKVMVTIPQNEDTAIKTLSVTFRTTNNNKVADLVTSTTFPYTQTSGLTINHTGPLGTIDGGRYSDYVINVTANSTAQWTVATKGIDTVYPTSGVGNGSVRISILENPSLTDTREIKIEFKTGSVVKATWSGIQDKGTRHRYSHDGWAGSNIYWDGTKLTFDNLGVTTHEQYMGVYFQYGSLVALSPDGNNFTNNTILFAPGTKDHNDKAWSPATNQNWTTIPKTKPVLYTATARHQLLEVHDPTKNIGDICKWMSDNGLAPATTYGWRLPSSWEFDNGGMDNSLPDMIGTAISVTPNRGGTTNVTGGYRSSDNPHKAFFPASGYRDGNSSARSAQGRMGYYWSGSANGNNGYRLFFNAGTTNQYSSNGASNPSGGFSVRCVKNKLY